MLEFVKKHCLLSPDNSRYRYDNCTMLSLNFMFSNQRQHAKSRYLYFQKIWCLSTILPAETTLK